jgi:4a-hydroxytetrahydrobiopterin dehydratase
MNVRGLSTTEIEAQLATLRGWRLVDGKLHREFTFADFVGAFGFMAQAALVAEKLQHHPDWRNVWNRVTVDLWTHDLGGLSAKDFQLAARLSQLAGDSA